ncbi:MAG: hypothetical protein Q4A92_11115 [Corynebacterium sp.]|nr:hypothetical protein [Corynebacterium sp.]
MEHAQKLAQQAMLAHYDEARVQLERKGLFGKDLDRKARKLALRLGGVRLPEGVTLAWATPDGWAEGGYRAAALSIKAVEA